MTDTTTTGRKAAAAAAKTLLAERIALVETLGDALDKHRRAVAAVTTAQAAADALADEAGAAYAAARDGGWTTAELNKAGLCAPARPRKRRRNGVAASSTDDAVTVSDTADNHQDDGNGSAEEHGQ